MVSSNRKMRITSIVLFVAGVLTCIGSGTFYLVYQLVKDNPNMPTWVPILPAAGLLLGLACAGVGFVVFVRAK